MHSRLEHDPFKASHRPRTHRPSEIESRRVRKLQRPHLIRQQIHGLGSGCCGLRQPITKPAAYTHDRDLWCRQVIGPAARPQFRTMHLLLIHQNFPGQFRDLAPAWLQQGHQVTALGSAPAPTDSRRWVGLTYLRYELPGDDNPSVLARGQAVAAACQQLQPNGTPPDIVLVHSGWGEARNLRDIFPRTPLVVFPELWGHPRALGYGFDHHLEANSQPVVV